MATRADLIKAGKEAVRLGVKYIYGAKPQKGKFVKYTLAQIRSLRRTYGTGCVWNSDDSKAGKLCCDCSGLMTYATGQVINSATLRARASRTVSIAYLRGHWSECIGYVLWLPGHVGIVSEKEGYYYAMDGSARNAAHLPLGRQSWRVAFPCPGVDYSKKWSEPAKTPAKKEDKVTYSQKLIDVSKWNGKIDWAKVKKAGYHAIIRCGFGDDRANQDDPRWLENAKACEAHGIPYGMYLYSYARTKAQAQSEAKHALRLAKGRKLSYPIYFDSEEPGTQTYAATAAKIFCDAIEKAGYWAGVYASESWWNSYLKKSLGNRYTKWIAKYGTNSGSPQSKPNVAKTDIWQYSSKGRVPGVSGNCDVNIVYRNLVSEIAKKAAAKKPASSTTNTKKPAAVTKKKTVTEIAKEVIAGKWGNGATRKKKLEAAGYNYASVQKKVNELMK